MLGRGARIMGLDPGMLLWPYFVPNSLHGRRLYSTVSGDKHVIDRGDRSVRSTMSAVVC